MIFRLYGLSELLLDQQDIFRAHTNGSFGLTDPILAIFINFHGILFFADMLFRVETLPDHQWVFIIKIIFSSQSK